MIVVATSFTATAEHDIDPHRIPHIVNEAMRDIDGHGRHIDTVDITYQGGRIRLDVTLRMALFGPAQRAVDDLAAAFTARAAEQGVTLERHDTSIAVGDPGPDTTTVRKVPLPPT